VDVVLLAIVAGIALAIVLGGLVLVWVARGWSRAADRRLAAAVGEMNERMESIVRELGEALERAETETRRAHRLSDVTASIDLDEVLARTLEATRQLPGADAAVISLAHGPEGRPVVATLGLSREEAERQPPIGGPPDGRAARAVGISYHYAPDELAGAEGVIHSGIAVPLMAEGEITGHLAVFTRARARSFGDDAVDELELLAKRAAPAIENARRFREARRLADLDALTGLHNRRYFHDTLDREVARAHRYHRELALAVYDLDDFKAVNDQIGHLDGDAVLAEAAERIRTVVRSADIPCRVGGDEFGVILPESSRVDAEQLSRRIQRAIDAEPLGQAGRLTVSAGVAELNGNDDARSLFQRADSALYRAKATDKGGIVSAGPKREVPSTDGDSKA
jgi:diguanylate cyclase (GGDEF)-like protein